MTESTPPPPESGGGSRYAILGILLLLGAIGVYFLMSGGDEQPPPIAAVIDAGVVQRPVMEPDIEIPDEEPDAGPQDAGIAEEPTMSTMRAPQPRECNGELTQQQILSVVGPARSQVRQCYERRLKVNNVLQGTVNVAVLVDRDGSIDQMRVGGSLRDNEVFACVRRIVEGWRFPPPSGGCVQVNVPFALSPQQ